MQSPYGVSIEDPDYLQANGETSKETVNRSLLEQDAKEEAVHKIQSIIHKQFSLEVHLKEREIELIDQRISQTRSMLDRLRGCVLARYYGTSTKSGREGSEHRRRAGKRRFMEATAHGKADTDASVNETSQKSDTTSSRIRSVSTNNNNTRTLLSLAETPQASTKQLNSSKDADSFAKSSKGISKDHSPMEMSFPANVSRPDLQGATLPDSKLDSQVGEPVKQNEVSRVIDSNCQHSGEIGFAKPSVIPVGKTGDQPGACATTNFHETEARLSQAGSRFYVKKRVIVGNTSKYIPLEGRETNDKSTHKWMVYVRGPPKDPRIERFIEKVWFFLHPSYRPNDIVEVKSPPFHLTRRGWGEFPVRVQLHFVDSRNKRVDIIHELKLDRTYTGLQTLGAETVVDLELDRKTFEDLGIPIVSSPSSPDPSALVHRNHSASANEGSYAADFTRVKSKETVFSMEIPQVKKLKLEEATSSELSPLSSLASTPDHSQASSRCASPETVKSSIHKFCDNIENTLHDGVKAHPLIDPERNLAKFPYCAKSVEQYLDWNTGKRRAAEWQRALTLKRHVQARTDARDLSTKAVMVWCRRYGYTPCDKAGCGEKSCFCKMCGLPVAQSNETEGEGSLGAIHEGCTDAGDSLNSLSSGTKLLLALEDKEHSLLDSMPQSNDDEDIVVDIVGEPREPPQRQAEPRSPGPVYSLPLRPEEEWVRDVCSDIGVKLQPVNFEGVQSHAVERALWSACSQFIEEILRHAWACAADRSNSSKTRLVVPRHVYGAIDMLPTCDFLLNSHLGSLERDDEPWPAYLSENLSLDVLLAQCRSISFCLQIRLFPGHMSFQTYNPGSDEIGTPPNSLCSGAFCPHNISDGYWLQNLTRRFWVYYHLQASVNH